MPADTCMIAAYGSYQVCRSDGVILQNQLPENAQSGNRSTLPIGGDIRISRFPTLATRSGCSSKQFYRRTSVSLGEIKQCTGQWLAELFAERRYGIR